MCLGTSPPFMTLVLRVNTFWISKGALEWSPLVGWRPWRRRGSVLPEFTTTTICDSVHWVLWIESSPMLCCFVSEISSRNRHQRIHVAGLIVATPKYMPESLPLFGNRVFAYVSRLRISRLNHPRLSGWAWSPTTSVIRDTKSRDTQRGEEKAAGRWRQESEWCSHKSERARSHQKLEEARRSLP